MQSAQTCKERSDHGKISGFDRLTTSQLNVQKNTWTNPETLLQFFFFFGHRSQAVSSAAQLRRRKL